MRWTLCLLAMCLSCVGHCWSDDFLGAPLPPGGQVLSRTEDRIVVRYATSHDHLLAFYQECFKGDANIRFRNWKTETYIEDDGALPWHSVRISKGEEGVTVTVTRDSWAWILGTLTLRFVGVFVVLVFLYAGISASGAVVSRLVAKPR